MWSGGYFDAVKVYPDSMSSSENFGSDLRGVAEVDDEFGACGTFSGRTRVDAISCCRGEDTGCEGWVLFASRLWRTGVDIGRIIEDAWVDPDGKKG
jgi:hypothetical protein